MNIPQSSQDMLDHLRYEILPAKTMDEWIDEYGTEYALLAALGQTKPGSKALVRDISEIERAVSDAGGTGVRAIVYIALVFYYDEEREIGGFHGLYRAYRHLDSELRECVLTLLKRVL